MKKITLRQITLQDQDAFFKAFHEDWEDFDFVFFWDTLAEENFEKFVSLMHGLPKGEGLPEGFVPGTFLFAFNEEGEMVGRTSIRHTLTENLKTYGGHVGYGVCPSHRRKGYATEILKETVAYMREELPEIKRILLTCSDDNLGSIKTIENNGGVLFDVRDTEHTERGQVVQRKTRRYWLTIPRYPQDFVVDESSIQKYGKQEKLKIEGNHANFSEYFHLNKIGVHTFVIPPGARTSEPHAEKLEEEFVFVISGEIDLWLNGNIKTMRRGDCIGFPAGTGLGHSFINNSMEDCKLFVAGDRTMEGNQYHFHLDPSLKEECGDNWWDDMPEQSLGDHNGLPGPYHPDLIDESLPTFNGYDNLTEATFSYPGDSETFGDGLCLSRHFGLKSIAVWLERLQPGKRASWPHAHSEEEEFVYILDGEASLWLNGIESTVGASKAIDFKAGSGVAHTIWNRTEEPLYYLCVGECETPDDKIFYPEHPNRNNEMKEKGVLWDSP